LNIPYQSYGKQDAPAVLFAHANGFPPGTYNALFADLGQDHAIYAPHLRPLWQPLPEHQTQAKNRAVWPHMAQDLNDFIEHHNIGPVIFVGHSMGAVAGVLAAQLKPHLYRQLILVEPVFLRRTITRILRFSPLALTHKVPIIAKAMGRPDRWDSLQQAFDFHRPKRVFADLTDEILWHYINAAVVADGDGFKLFYDKYWEATMYGTVPSLWRTLKRSKVAISVLRGQKSETVDDLAWKRWQAVQSRTDLPQHVRAINFEDAGHLLPLEQPQRVAQKIRHCLLPD
jgi:pimeloyl-ACP methyl ester carboxylesterase